MRDKATPCTHPIGRESKKTIGRCSAPLRIARWKVCANVAVGERTKDRICQRMKRDVGVRMSGESVVAGNSNAAQSDVITRSESVHVET